MLPQTTKKQWVREVTIKVGAKATATTKDGTTREDGIKAMGVVASMQTSVVWPTNLWRCSAKVPR